MEVTGYMCQIDFNWELDSVSDGTKVYPTVEDLKVHHSCADTCGVVKVTVKLESVIIEGKYS